MRCFVAVDIPEELKSKIKELQDQLSSCDVKLVEPKNLHFTLKFLGELEENAIKEVNQRLSEIASNLPSFSILLSSVGVFPSASYIRVIWIGSKSQDFANLHKAVADALQDIGEPEKEAIPHLTIARVHSP
ncbi:MAG: RNA 2',3'-cyclic phosphodiesterase, partial [Candidatus Aenigmarchaeota archaeon]|nr:RNA 2',3'-cyclic phosphodiesterase [Candidatus Aenigmarchaeota archaeon]